MLTSFITLITLTTFIMIALYTLLMRHLGVTFKQALKGLLKVNGITKGMFLVLLFVAVMFLSISAVKADDNIKWFDSTTLFVGLDNTKKQSPMCHQGGANDHLTSNVGVSQNILVLNGVDVDLEYTHHSCAISDDSNQYDAIGLKLSYTWR